MGERAEMSYGRIRRWKGSEGGWYTYKGSSVGLKRFARDGKRLVLIKKAPVIGR